MGSMRTTRFLQWLGALGLLLFLATAFSPLASLVNRQLEHTPSVEPADAIVVLGGGGVRGDGTLSDVSMRRTLHGIALYQRHLAPLVVFSGPRARSGFVEGEIRAGVARALGVPAAAIVTETSAHTTREEALRIAGILLPRGARRILLVVEPSGMRRAGGVFQRAGFEPLPAPVNDAATASTPEARLGLARRLLIELTGLLYYHAAGYL